MKAGGRVCAVRRRSVWKKKTCELCDIAAWVNDPLALKYVDEQVTYFLNMWNELCPGGKDPIQLLQQYQ